MSTHDYSGIDRAAGRSRPAVGAGLFAAGALLALTAALAVGGWAWVVVSYGRALAE